MSSNTSDNLLTALGIALGDTDDLAWTNAEKDDLIRWSLADLYPRLKREIDPTNATYQITLVASTYSYALPTGVLEVYAIDWLDTSGNPLGKLDDQVWLIRGDPLTGTGTLQMAPTINDTLGTLQLRGYARYDGITNLIPDEYVPMVVAYARAECYRRLVTNRVKFEQWLTRSQTQNVTAYEMILMLNEAEREFTTQAGRHRTMQRPVPGRLG